MKRRALARRSIGSKAVFGAITLGLIGTVGYAYSIQRERNELMSAQKADREAAVRAGEQVAKLIDELKQSVTGVSEPIRKLLEVNGNSSTLNEADRRAVRALLNKYDPQSDNTGTPPAVPETLEAILALDARRIALEGPNKIGTAVAFGDLKGQLDYPAIGPISLRYGEKTRAGAQSTGIVIETRQGATLTSPADGWVVYAGDFRSYGTIVIVNAGAGYNIVLAGLGGVDVTLGKFVLRNEPLGKMPTATAGAKVDEGAYLYVEFRKDGAPVDPTPWWKSDTPDPQNTISPTGNMWLWPVNGRILERFGERPDGTWNDGINIMAPRGTDVVAADGGKVAYAGTELKNYGNLVLIRHEEGWVTAYAHLERFSAKRGDTVTRGQVIGRVGTTGLIKADQPQLHFELRKGQKPVDPLLNLPK